MLGRRPYRNDSHEPRKVLLTLLCVLLVAIFGIVQAAHFHPESNVAHADCALCAATHVAVPVASTPVSAPAVAVFVRLDASTVPSVASPVSTFALFTRPPPARILPA